MFGSSKKQPAEKKTPDVKVDAMPASFYGGKDPEIYHSASDTTVGMNREAKKEATSPVKKEPIETPPLQPPSTAQPSVNKPELALAGASSMKSAHPKRSFLWVWILLAVVLLALIAGGLWYYYQSAQDASIVGEQQPSPPVVTDVVVPPVVIPEPPVVEEITIPTSTPAEEDGIDAPSLTEELLPPLVQLVAAADIDDDELRDQEEEIFGTDSGTWDSDGDGYYDGLEISNLYSPNDLAPTKLVDSGLIKEYVNPIWGYRVYAPLEWAVDPVDPDARQVIMTNISGDFIELRVFDKQANELFFDWFARVVKDDSIIDYREEDNRFKVGARIRDDRLLALYETDTQVYAIIYTPGNTTILQYPTVMEMVVQSFRPAANNILLPEQVVLPTTTAAIIPPITAPAVTTTPIEENTTSTNISPVDGDMASVAQEDAEPIQEAEESPLIPPTEEGGESDSLSFF